MNEDLRKFLISINCTIINAIKKSLTDKTIVGWHCKSTSTLKSEKHFSDIKKFIAENKIEYFFTEGNKATAEFFIYINKTDG